MNFSQSRVTGETTLPKLTSLSSSVVKLLDTALNLQAGRQPALVVKSRIFNGTTWRNLSNETWSVIGRAGETWIRKSARFVENRENRTRLNEATDPFTKLARAYQLLDASAELLAGGDIWQKVRAVYESSRVKPILTLIEDLPNLAVAGVDTFVKSERLNDFVEKLSLGKVHPCDIDKYLIVPSFVRKKVLLSSITNFCQKIVLNERRLTLIDILPLDVKFEVRRSTKLRNFHNISLQTTFVPSNAVARDILQERRRWRNSSDAYDESYLLKKLARVESTIVRAASEGYKDPKVPIWWTSFREGSLEDFLAQYRKEVRIENPSDTKIHRLYEENRSPGLDCSRALGGEEGVHDRWERSEFRREYQVSDRSLSAFAEFVYYAPARLIGKVFFQRLFVVRHDPPRNSQFPAAEPSAVREASVSVAQVEHIEDPRYPDARFLLE